MDGRSIIYMLDFARWMGSRCVLLLFDHLIASLFVWVGMCFIPFGLCSWVRILAQALVHRA